MDVQKEWQKVARVSIETNPMQKALYKTVEGTHYIGGKWMIYDLLLASALEYSGTKFLNKSHRKYIFEASKFFNLSKADMKSVMKLVKSEYDLMKRADSIWALDPNDLHSTHAIDSKGGDDLNDTFRRLDSGASADSASAKFRSLAVPSAHSPPISIDENINITSNTGVHHQVASNVTTRS